MNHLMSDRDILGRGALLLGTALIASVVVPFVLAILLFALSLPLHAATFVVAQLLVAVGTFLLGWREGQGSGYLATITLLLITIISAAVWVAGDHYDLSWDGMAYHQEAIIQLTNGWNPLASHLDDAIIHSLWINHYPKASWIYAALLFKLTGNIESGKAYQLILALAALSIVLAAALRIQKLPLWLAIGCAVLAAANPVVIYQSLSYYVDGALGSILTAMIAVSLLLFFSDAKRLALLWIILGVLAINMKFTGVPYVAITGISVIAIASIAKRWQLVKLSSVMLTLTLVIGAIIVGYNPYVKNLIGHGHPFYPVRGDHSIDIMSYNTPKGMLTMGRVEKFFFGIFAESNNDIESEALSLSLLPPTSSISDFSSTDMRVGGWGPLFGRIIIVLAIGLLFTLTVAPRPRYAGKWIGAISVAIFLSVVVNPEAWWARYTPQLWLIPLLIGIWFSIQSSVAVRCLGGVTLLLLTLNTLLVANAYFSYNITANAELRAQLANLAASRISLQADFGPFEALRQRLSAAGVIFLITPAATQHCATPIELTGAAFYTVLCKG